MRRDYYNRSIWKPALTAAGLAEDTTFHDLRHAFASTALAEGVPISEVSRWLGGTDLPRPYWICAGIWFLRPAAERVTPWIKRSMRSYVPRRTSRPAPPQVRGKMGGVSRPVGRVLCARLRGATVIHLGLPLPTASCGLPASIGRAALKHSRREPLVPLLTLLRVGFTEPPQSPAALVVSYTTVSPLPSQ
jgi:hypothetical protein